MHISYDKLVVYHMLGIQDTECHHVQDAPELCTLSRGCEMAKLVTGSLLVLPTRQCRKLRTRTMLQFFFNDQNAVLFNQRSTLLVLSFAIWKKNTKMCTDITAFVAK